MSTTTVDCAGSPRELGLAQGRALAGLVRGAHEALASLEVFRMRQPWWLPYPLFRRGAERKARSLLEAAWRRDFPSMDQRLQGLAEGAGIRLESLYLMNSLEAFLSTLGDAVASPTGEGLPEVVPVPAACSAAAVRGAKSASGEPMIARNFDYLPLVQPYFCVRRTRPTGGRASVDLTVAPLVGAVDGLNDAGLAITYDYGYSTDRSEPSGTLSMAISEALERCATVEEAARHIASRPRWGGGLLMLADASGDIASLELSNTRSALRRPEPGEDTLVHSNKYSVEAMTEVQVADDARFTERGPKALRGKRVHDSAEKRAARIGELLAKAGPLTPETLGAVMADHGPDGRPKGTSPCVHSDYWNTTACVQLFPRSRRARISFTHACQPSFTDFSL